MNRAFCLIVFVTLCLTLPVGFKRLTHGFKIAKMQIDYPYAPEFDLDLKIPEEALSILSQPFYYLDRGSQSYVFASQDGRYVLKFFRYHPQQKNLRDVVSRMLNGARIAYLFTKQETGLVYVHLNLTKNQLPILQLKDPLRRSLKLPLDDYRFVLQKRGVSLEEAFAQGSIEPRIDAFLSLIQGRLQKGIGNSDSNISRNFGFLEEAALEFDFGNYALSPDLLLPEHQQREMRRYVDKLRTWMSRHAPEGLGYLDYLDQVNIE